MRNAALNDVIQASCCFKASASPPPAEQMMAKPGESPVSRQHQSHPEETEEELREHQDGGGTALPPGVTIKQEPPDPQELQEEALHRQAEQELLFRQVRLGGLEGRGGLLERSRVKMPKGQIDIEIDCETLMASAVKL